MNKKRYTAEDIEKAYQSGFKKGINITIENAIFISSEFIHPKLLNGFRVKLRKEIFNEEKTAE